MATLWDRIRALEGRTLTTESRRAVFDVIEVNETRARVVPRSSGTSRHGIRRREFDRAEALGLIRSDVTPSQLQRAGVSRFNSSYVAAMIRAALGPKHRS